MRVSCTLLELGARYALDLQVGEGISFAKDLSLPSIDPNDTQACYFSESPAGLENSERDEHDPGSTTNQLTCRMHKMSGTDRNVRI